MNAYLFTTLCHAQNVGLLRTLSLSRGTRIVNCSLSCLADDMRCFWSLRRDINSLSCMFDSFTTIHAPFISTESFRVFRRPPLVI